MTWSRYCRLSYNNTRTNGIVIIIIIIIIIIVVIIIVAIIIIVIINLKQDNSVTNHNAFPTVKCNIFLEGLPN